MEQVNALVALLYCKAVAFMRDEEGDTNFISVMVLLAIALAIAATFIAYKDKVLDFVKETVPDMFAI